MSQKNQDRPSGGILPEEIKSAEQVALSFVAAYKYYSLYPRGHAFSQNHLHRLYEDLTNFLKTHKSLKLDIEKHAFTYHGIPLINGTADENNPAYLLTRDRILFLEFSRNIQLDEIIALFDIFNVHRNPMEETDGDIATSLWHIPFNHIHYEAADILAMEAIDFDLSMFKPLPGAAFSAADDDRSAPGPEKGRRTTDNRRKKSSFGNHEGTDQHYAGFYENGDDLEMDSQNGPERNAPGLLLIARENDLSELTNHEKLVLESYVQTHEERDLAGDTIDVLLILLSVESDQIEFATLLDFLEFEYFESLMKKEYHLANRICKNIENIATVVRAKKPWAQTLINIFLTALAKEERYQQLPMITEGDHFAPDPEQLKYLLSVFDMLPADIIFIPAALARRTSPDNLRQRNELLEIIEKKARMAPGNLLLLMEKSDESSCGYLFPIIEEMEVREACGMYLAMTHQAFASVRRMGLESLFQKNCRPAPEDLLHLLGDEDEQTRQKTLSYFETLGGKAVQEAIIRYLQSDTARHDDQLHILQCYRLLGGSLSDISMEFLRDVLLGSKITSVFSKMSMVHKKGAAYALMRSGRPDARKLVQRGAESVRPDVRHACQKILEHS